jgi:hypothetical protein
LVKPISFKRNRVPAGIIHHAVSLYFRFRAEADAGWSAVVA